MVVKRDHTRGYPKKGISVRIHRDAIVGKVGEGHFEKGCDFVKLTEASYETFLRYQNDVADLLPEKEGGVKDSDLGSYDDETH